MLRTASQRAVQMMAALAIVFAAIGAVAATSTQAHADVLDTPAAPVFKGYTSSGQAAVYVNLQAVDGVEIQFTPKNTNLASKTFTQDLYLSAPASGNLAASYLSKTSAYKMTMRTYVYAYGEKYYSDWSAARYMMPQPKAKMKLVSKRSLKKGIKISWNKVAGATSYTLYTSTKNGSYKKVGTYKGTSKIVKKIKGKSIKKRKYFAYVIANGCGVKSPKYQYTRLTIY